MDVHPLLILPAGAALVAGLLFLHRATRDRGVFRLLGWSWTGLWLAILVLGQAVPLAQPGIRIALGVATALILIGALELLRQREIQQRRLDDQHRTLLATLESSPDGMLLGGRDGAVLHMSGPFAELFALDDASGWQGRPTSELLQVLRARVESSPRAGTELNRIEADPMAVIEDLEIELVEPEARTLTCYSAPIVSPDGSHLGRVSVVRDRTEERRLEAELRHAQRMETIGTLAGGVAHDFNNQLTAIFGNLALVRASTGDPSTIAGALHDLETAADHCAKVTRSLLTFSRRAPMRTQVVDMTQIIEDVAEVVRGSSPETLELELDVDPDLLRIEGDVAQLHQLLLNLLLNARDAVSGEGTLRVRAKNLQPELPPSTAEIELATASESPAGFLSLIVEDDGVGMGSETVERIFDPFFSTKPQGQGTGLGLSIVHSLVQSHGGWIEVDSVPGRGSRFEIVLPGVEADPDPEAQTGEAPASSSQLILIADDEAALRKLIKRALTGHGYQVLEANDGQEAIEIYRERAAEVALLLLDLSMPRMDGKQVIQQVHEEHPEVPIILASGHFGEERPSLGGGVELLPKPFTLEGLLRIVRQQIAVSTHHPPMGGAATGDIDELTH